MNSNFIGEMILKYRFQIVIFLIGALLVAFGFYKKQIVSDPVEIVEENNNSDHDVGGVFVEISGAVTSPGVYELPSGSRINDLIDAAGGTQGEDIEWVERFINRASVLRDGQKVIIPKESEHSFNESDNNFNNESEDILGVDSTQSKYVNINTASQKELESLWGIGPVYAQKIIEQRPYSTIEELIDKNIIKSNVYEKNKDLLTVY